MTITIPVWLLWVIGIPLGVFILWLAFLGIGMLRTILEWRWR